MTVNYKLQKFLRDKILTFLSQDIQIYHFAKENISYINNIMPKNVKGITMT